MKNKQKFEELYKQYSAELFRFSAFRLNSREEAEDIVAESFIKLYQEDVDSIQNHRAWLYKVTRNLMYDKYIKDKKQNEVNGMDYDESIENYDLSVEEQAINEETVKFVESELRNLDPITSEIITLKLWNEMEFDEISEVIEDMNKETVRKRFYRGLDQLKNILSTKEKQLSIKSFTIPFLLAGITSVAIQPAYAWSGATGGSIAGSIGSTLGFTFSNMVTNMSGAATSSAAGATAASSASSAVGLFGSGILATTTAKIIAGSAILVAGTGVGLGVVAVANQGNNNDSNQQEQNDKSNVPDDTSTECELETYTNDVIPDFSFKYDPCEWTLTKNISITLEQGSNYIGDSIELTNNDTATKLAFNFNSFYIGGFGRTETCGTGSPVQIKDKIYRVSTNNLIAGDSTKGEWVRDNSELDYKYSSRLAFKDDADISNYSGYDFVIPVEAEYCIGTKFFTKSIFTSDQVSPNPEQSLLTYYFINLASINEEKSLLADGIIKSMEWESSEQSTNSKTYSNPDFGIEFQYSDSDTQINTSTGGGGLPKLNIERRLTTGIEPLSIVITKNLKIDASTYDQLFNYVQTSFGGGDTSVTRTTIGNNIQAVEEYTKGCISSESICNYQIYSVKYYYIFHNGSIWSISINDVDEHSKQEMITTIISSLKLI